MNNLPTNKTKCLLTKQGIEIWITPEQAKQISQIIGTTTSIKTIEIEGQTVGIDNITGGGIYDAEYIFRQRKIKAGMWECDSCKRWHPRFEECGCQGGKYK